jgi:putrescine aminotransferase
VGHRHPRLIAAAKQALDEQPMPSKVFFSAHVGALAEKLAEITPGDLQFSFYCNSGTEAVEGAVKAARAASGRHGIISTHGGYHGKSFGSLSLTGREKFQKPFEPLLSGVKFVQFGDAAAVEEAIDDSIGAVIVEPIQGESGIHVPPDGYLRDIRKICDERGIVFILDEVQTGFGRTGEMFAMNHEQVVPDIATFAKGLSGGIVPIGAFMGTPKVWDALFGENPVVHTSTFGGGPLACRVALAAIEVIEEEHLCENSRERGEQMLNGLEQVKNQFPELLSAVRGRGLMIGAEFAIDDAAELCIAQMVKRDVVAAYTLNNPRVIRFEPPLTINPVEVDRAVDVFGEAVAETAELVAAVNA